MSNIHIVCNSSQYTITINNTHSLYGPTKIFYDKAADTDISSGAEFYLQHLYNNATDANVFVYNSDLSHNYASFGVRMFIVWQASSVGKW